MPSSINCKVDFHCWQSQCISYNIGKWCNSFWSVAIVTHPFSAKILLWKGFGNDINQNEVFLKTTSITIRALKYGASAKIVLCARYEKAALLLGIFFKFPGKPIEKTIPSVTIVESAWPLRALWKKPNANFNFLTLCLLIPKSESRNSNLIPLPMDWIGYCQRTCAFCS